jgi:hypothetical protein
LAEGLELTCAPDLSVETEVLCDAEAPACVSADICARQVPVSKIPATTKIMILFMFGFLTEGFECRLHAIGGMEQGLSESDT